MIVCSFLYLRKFQLMQQLHQPLLRRDVVLEVRRERRIPQLIREALSQAIPRVDYRSISDSIE